MTPDQIDIALSELETRVDRLRSLYEQYFMGIERMEPHVPRKDVERRFNELRKVPFRNTARRFKFQTLVQRYNTMQQYWQRICREIENGTYKRHKLRAEKAFGNVLDNPMAAREQTAPERPRVESDERELASLYDEVHDTDAALRAALADAEAHEPAAAKPEPAKGKGLLAQLKSTKEGEAPAPRPAAPPGPPPRASTAPRPPGPPGPPPRPSSPPQPATAGPTPLRNATGPRPDLPPLPPRTATGPRPDLPPLPPRPTATAPGAVQRPDPTRAEPTRTEPTRTEPHRPAQTRPEPARPEPARPAPAAATSLSEERIRALHRDYVDARTRTNATPVSFEKLAQNLRETEKKLRTEHSGKNVDFEVVVKDGKAILKPKLR